MINNSPMQEKAKQFLKNHLSPMLLRFICGENVVVWSGDYDSWEQAEKVTSGYDSQIILNKVKDSLLKVKNGQATFERDSVLFEEIQYSWPLLAGLMWISAQSRGQLNVIDFGGSLGSTYFQNRTFLESLSSVRWNIVEQKLFVDAGKKYFENNVIKFFYTLEASLEETSPNTILFSSVIQYLKNPYSLLKKVKELDIEFILFDRTPFTIDRKDRLTIQSIPSKIYPGSYPCWFFNKEKFYAFFEGKYTVVAKFQSLDKANIPSTFEGSILKRK